MSKNRRRAMTSNELAASLHQTELQNQQTTKIVDILNSLIKLTVTQLDTDKQTSFQLELSDLIAKYLDELSKEHEPKAPVAQSNELAQEYDFQPKRTLDDLKNQNDTTISVPSTESTESNDVELISQWSPLFARFRSLHHQKLESLVPELKHKISRSAWDVFVDSVVFGGLTEKEAHLVVEQLISEVINAVQLTVELKQNNTTC
ncbi:hypothetical protein M3Y94_01202200 [Aphelenchoides besseyi]|nr:hypothetical protein M3Y94_01202200 [Aphelenchoides besseyi]KAI6228443.1 hypothetical protein M3Y95_00622800 [Aphelenchoides besseyi]